VLNLYELYTDGCFECVGFYWFVEDDGIYTPFMRFALDLIFKDII